MSDKDSSKTPTRSLYMTHKVATQLHEEAKTKETERMAAHAKLEEEKIIKRRAKQEQHLAMRVAKKALYQAAKDGEKNVTIACEDLENTLKVRTAHKKDDAAAEANVQLAAQKVGALKKRLDIAREKLEESIRVQDTVRKMTDGSIVEQKSQKLRESWTNSKAAWDKIQKAVFKKDHDRALKKRVKGLLDL